VTAKSRQGGGRSRGLFQSSTTPSTSPRAKVDLQKRRARNFIFTPTACGSTRFDVPPAMISSLDCASEAATPLSLAEHKPEGTAENSDSSNADAASTMTPAERVKKGITLGAAMAISRAAQSPNQGSHTSPAVAALLTLANIRLGWWLGNPGNQKTCTKEGPTNGLRPMLDELQAQATDKNEYVYLSDGGHFENLGLYELIRRRCSLVMLCDADCDPNYKFDDLVNAIELCQVDFGATITIDTDTLQNTLKAGWCRSAFTVGRIKYAPENGKSKTGTLIYLKSAVTRNNSIVVHSYDRQSRPFPHEPTTNQWFDETQFEAYRLLGQETPNSALEGLKKNGSVSYRGNGNSFNPPSWWNKEREQWEEHARTTELLLWLKPKQAKAENPAA
jgi:hypothetical protein